MVCRDEAPRGLNTAGLDNDHVNTELFNFHAQCIAERFEGVLGGVVPGSEGHGNTPRHRGEVQDAPATPCAHMRQHQLGEARQAEEIHLELATCLVDGDVFNSAVKSVARVVDEHVNAAFCVNDLLYGGFHGCLIGNVQAQRFHTLGGELFNLLNAAGGTVYGVAVAHQ